MSPKFSLRSIHVRDTLDPRLALVLDYVIGEMGIDITLLEGYRDRVTQERYFSEGKTKLHWPNSKHNKYPSKAVDVVPYPILWNDSSKAVRAQYDKEVIRVLTIIQMVALFKFDLKLRWGGDWDRDWSISDNRFNDYPHLEIDE